MTDIDDSHPPISGLRQRRYPNTPMPNQIDQDDDEDSFEDLPRHEEPEDDHVKSRLCENIMFFILVTIAIAYFWTVSTLRTDVNILVQYQKEHVDQYKYISKLLENMHQVKWQMVPAIQQ